jgi:hypothetical protein
MSCSTSHHDIAFACVSQLIQTLDFANSDIPSATLTETVGLGLLGLQEYALEYWISHVFHYVEATDGLLDLRSPLLTQLLRFAAKHTDVAMAQPNTTPGLSESTGNLLEGIIPSKLKAVPEIHNFIFQVLNFRHKFDAKQASEGPGKSEWCG